jgi:hypothetical protein
LSVLKKTADDFSIITIAKYIADLRDRPFNLKGGGMVFCFVQNFFFGQHKSWNIDFFLSRNFFPESNNEHPLIVERQLLANQHFTFRVNPGERQIKEFFIGQTS